MSGWTPSRHARLDGVELGEPARRPCFVAHDAGVLGHGVADGALQGADVLRAVGGEQLVDLGACVCSADAERGCALSERRVGGGGLSDDAAEDEQFDQGVPAEAVGAVQPTGRLADGVEALDIRAVVLGSHPDPAHRVVRGGRDLDGRLRDVEHLQLEQGLVDAGQARS